MKSTFFPEVLFNETDFSLVSKLISSPAKLKAVLLSPICYTPSVSLSKCPSSILFKAQKEVWNMIGSCSFLLTNLESIRWCHQYLFLGKAICTTTSLFNFIFLWLIQWEQIACFENLKLRENTHDPQISSTRVKKIFLLFWSCTLIRLKEKCVT